MIFLQSEINIELISYIKISNFLLSIDLFSFEEIIQERRLKPSYYCLQIQKIQSSEIKCLD